MAQLQARLNVEERRLEDVVGVCRTCAGFAPREGTVPCDSRDCPVFYTRVRQEVKVGVERAGLERVGRRLLGVKGELEW